MTIKTAFEIEGFIINQDTEKPATSLNGQRIDQAIFQAFKNQAIETSNQVNHILNSLSTEEFAFHFEIKNTIPHPDHKDAIAEINQITTILRGFLREHNLNIVFQPFLKNDPEEKDLSDDQLTDNARNLMRSQGWTMQDMKKTIISGFQVNRDIPQEISEKGLALDFARHLYNLTSEQYEALSGFNTSSDRQNIIQDLLISSDKDIFDDSRQSFSPGNFQTNQEMQEYFRIKTGASSVNRKLTIKHLHSLTIKPKGEEVAIINFQPSYIEWRVFDSLDPSTREGDNSIQKIMTLISSFEAVAMDQTLNPSSSSQFLRFPMAPHPLDRSHPVPLGE
jgi:hypothetical protein